VTSANRLLPKTSHRVAVATGVVATALLAVGFTGLSVSMVAAAADADALDSANPLTQAVVSPEVPVIPPVPGARVNEVFGAKGGHWIVAHSGIDFEVNNGTPIQAVVTGRIASVSTHPAYGKLVRLVRPDKVEVWFCHLSVVAVVPGQQVRQGEVLGLTGETGNATGPHLHIEVRTHRLPTDPGTFFFTTPGVPGVSPAWAKPYWEKPIEGYSMVNKKHEYVPGPPVH